MKFLYIFLLFFFTACTHTHSEVPVAAKFPTTYQKKLQAAEHWSLIAADISNKLKKSIKNKVTNKEKILISEKNGSPFSKLISYELISALTNEGYVVLNQTKVNKEQLLNTVNIDLETQVLEFGKNRKMAGRIGVPSAIATGLWVLDLVDESVAGVITAGVYANDAYEYFNSDRFSGNAPKSEIVVNITTSKDDEYISAVRDIYYVSQSDKRLYEETAESKTYKITGE